MPICNSMDLQDCRLIHMMATNSVQTYRMAQIKMVEMYGAQIDTLEADVFGT